MYKTFWDILDIKTIKRQIQEYNLSLILILYSYYVLIDKTDFSIKSYCNN